MFWVHAQLHSLLLANSGVIAEDKSPNRFGNFHVGGMSKNHETGLSQLFDLVQEDVKVLLSMTS